MIVIQLNLAISHFIILKSNHFLLDILFQSLTMCCLEPLTSQTIFLSPIRVKVGGFQLCVALLQCTVVLSSAVFLDNMIADGEAMFVKVNPVVINTEFLHTMLLHF